MNPNCAQNSVTHLFHRCLMFTFAVLKACSAIIKYNNIPEFMKVICALTEKLLKVNTR